MFYLYTVPTDQCHTVVLNLLVRYIMYVLMTYIVSMSRKPVSTWSKQFDLITFDINHINIIVMGKE